jgi:3-hexulose-6-phosphate synthase / 6-phospho-3-hexuloisomerase
MPALTSMNSKSRPLLQVAVDALSIKQALQTVGQIYPHVDIIEIGTPLLIGEGLSALEAIKAKFPGKKYLADLKIMDAGKIEATSAFQRGADIVTVLAAADDLTIHGTLEAAEGHGGQVMADLINVRDPVGRAIELSAMRVPILCLHTAFDRRGPDKDILYLLEIVRPVVSCRLAIAGGLTADTVRQALSKGSDIVVVGSGITDQPDPGKVARTIMKELEEWRDWGYPPWGGERASMISDIKNVLTEIVGEVGACLGKVRLESIEQALLTVTSARRVFLAGCGRSALGIRGFAMRLMHLGIDAHLVGETTTPPIGAGDCLIIGSGSGTTASLVAIAEKAKETGAKILLFTIDRNSPLAQLANSVVVIPASSPKARISTPDGESVQPMGSLFEQCLFLLLDALVLVLMQNANVTAAEMFTRHANLE